MNTFLPLIKADEKRQLIYARATAEQIDKTNEILDYATAVPQFQKWSDEMVKATRGLSKGNLRAQHNPKHAAGRIDQLIYKDDEKAIDVVAKIVDPVDWQKVCEGVYTGLSIGGGYLKKWTDETTGATRYTPKITEISLVDRPCLPTATIMELAKRDGTTEEVLLKGIPPRTFAQLLPPPSFDDVRKGVGGIAGSIGGSLAGEKVGQWGGAALGGTLGSVIGPEGTVAGAAAGRVLGGIAGSMIGGHVGGSVGEASESSGASTGGGVAGASKIRTQKTPKLKLPRMPTAKSEPAGELHKDFHPMRGLRDRLRSQLDAVTDSHTDWRKRKRGSLGKSSAWKAIVAGAGGGIAGTALGSHGSNSATGSAVGGETGATVGEAIGAHFGGLPGAAIGGLVGGASGAFLGGKVGPKKKEKKQPVAKAWRSLRVGRRLPGIHYGARPGVRPPMTPATSIMHRAARPQAPKPSGHGPVPRQSFTTGHGGMGGGGMGKRWDHSKHPREHTGQFASKPGERIGRFTAGGAGAVGGFLLGRKYGPKLGEQIGRKGGLLYRKLRGGDSRARERSEMKAGNFGHVIGMLHGGTAGATALGLGGALAGGAAGALLDRAARRRRAKKAGRLDVYQRLNAKTSVQPNTFKQVKRSAKDAARAGRKIQRVADTVMGKSVMGDELSGAAYAITRQLEKGAAGEAGAAVIRHLGHHVIPKYLAAAGAAAGAVGGFKLGRRGLGRAAERAARRNEGTGIKPPPFAMHGHNAIVRHGETIVHPLGARLTSRQKRLLMGGLGATTAAGALGGAVAAHQASSHTARHVDRKLGRPLGPGERPPWKRRRIGKVEADGELEKLNLGRSAAASVGARLGSRLGGARGAKIGAKLGAYAGGAGPYAHARMQRAMGQSEGLGMRLGGKIGTARAKGMPANEGVNTVVRSAKLGGKIGRYAPPAALAATGALAAGAGVAALRRRKAEKLEQAGELEKVNWAGIGTKVGEAVGGAATRVGASRVGQAVSGAVGRVGSSRIGQAVSGTAEDVAGRVGSSRIGQAAVSTAKDSFAGAQAAGARMGARSAARAALMTGGGVGRGLSAARQGAKIGAYAPHAALGAVAAGAGLVAAHHMLSGGDRNQKLEQAGELEKFSMRGTYGHLASMARTARSKGGRAAMREAAAKPVQTKFQAAVSRGVQQAHQGIKQVGAAGEQMGRDLGQRMGVRIARNMPSHVGPIGRMATVGRAADFGAKAGRHAAHAAIGAGVAGGAIGVGAGGYAAHRVLSRNDDNEKMEKWLPTVAGMLVGHAVGSRLGAHLGGKLGLHRHGVGAALGYPGSIRGLFGHAVGGAVAGGVTGAVLGGKFGHKYERKQKNKGAATNKAELIESLQKNILLQDDNTVSQWKQARSDQWESRPFYQMPKDTNDPKQVVMPGFAEQAYGKSEDSLYGTLQKGLVRGASRNASPISSNLDPLDRGYADIESAGQGTQAGSFTKQALNRRNLALRKFGSAVVFPSSDTSLDVVGGVFGGRAISKVADGVVPRVAVEVTDHSVFRSRAKESLGNEAVDSKRMLTSLSGKLGKGILPVVRAAGSMFSDEPIIRRVGNSTAFAGSHAAQTADLTLPLPSGDVAPLLKAQGLPSSPERRAKISEVLHEFKHGKLKAYRSDLPKRKMPKVRDRQQAIAIALNQARRMGKAEPQFVAALADWMLEKKEKDKGYRTYGPIATGSHLRNVVTSPEFESYGHKKGEAYIRRGEKEDDSLTQSLANAAHKQGRQATVKLGGAALGAKIAGHAMQQVPRSLHAPAIIGGMLAGQAITGDLYDTARAGGAALTATARRAHQTHQTRKKIGQLSEKEHAQRVEAAKARWKREGHPDMEGHHKALEAHASRSIIGRDAKAAAVREQAQHFWHHAADAHEAYDKMKQHVPSDSSVVVEVPHSGGMLYNPEKIGRDHFNSWGAPKKRIYLMHPAETDKWIKKHGKNADEVGKAEPFGEIQHEDELYELEKGIIADALAHGAALAGRAKSAIGSAAVSAGQKAVGSKVGQKLLATGPGQRVAAEFPNAKAHWKEGYGAATGRLAGAAIGGERGAKIGGNLGFAAELAPDVYMGGDIARRVFGGKKKDKAAEKMADAVPA